MRLSCDRYATTLRLMLLLVIVLTLPAIAFAQPETPETTFDFEGALATVTALVAAIIAISEYIQKWAKSVVVTIDGWKARALTFGVTAGLVCLGYFTKMGLFAEDFIQAQPWYYAVPTGTLLFGLVAMGVFGTKVAELALKLIKARKKPTTPPNK